MSISSDKSVGEADCMHEGVHNPDDSSYRINLLAQDEVRLLAERSDEHQKAASAKQRFFLGKIPPRRLALCGGGIRCIAHVGVFKELSKHNYLTHVKEIFGVSGGALIGLAYCLGYSLEQLERLALELDFSILKNISPESAFEFPITFGLDSGDGLDKIVTALITKKGFAADVVFNKIKFTCGFRCYATDLQTKSVREFSVSKTPLVSVKTAVRASMSLPFLYTPVPDPVTGNLLMDGGILHNLPIVFLNGKEREETLAVLFTKSNSVKVKSIDLLEVFQLVYDSMTFMRNEPFIQAFKKNIILVPVCGISPINFELSKEQKQNLIQIAADETKKYLFTPSAKPIRRFSCS